MNPNTAEIVRLTEAQEGFLDLLERSGAPEDLQSRMADKFSGLIPLTEDQEKKLTPLNAHARKGWMRNQPCICGSGLKFKRCCWPKFERLANGRA